MEGAEGTLAGAVPATNRENVHHATSLPTGHPLRNSVYAAAAELYAEQAYLYQQQSAQSAQEQLNEHNAHLTDHPSPWESQIVAAAAAGAGAKGAAQRVDDGAQGDMLYQAQRVMEAMERHAELDVQQSAHYSQVSGRSLKKSPSCSPACHASHVTAHLSPYALSLRLSMHTLFRDVMQLHIRS